MSIRIRLHSLVAFLATTVLISNTALAATKTWDGGAGTVSGTINTGLSTAQTLNFYLWDVGTTANWSGSTFAANDDAVFNQASGAYLIRVASNALDPLSETFTGGATYDFLRASTAASPASLNGSGSNYAGWHSVTAAGVQLSPAAYSIAGPDSFGSSGATDGFITAGNPNGYSTSTGSITLGSGFTGTVILRARPAAIGAGSTVVHTINSGTLEVHDAAALPAAVQNNPSLTLNGGTFAVNIDTGNYTFRSGNLAPGSTQHAGTLTVSDNSTIANATVDVYGRAREMNGVWNGAISVAAGKTLTVNTGGGTSLGNGNVATAAFSGTGTIKIGTEVVSGAGSNRLRLSGNQLSLGSSTLSFDLGTNGILQNSVNAGSTTSLGNVSSVSGTTITGTTNTASATQSASSVAIGGANGNSTVAGTIVNGVGSANSGALASTTGARNVTNTNITKNGTGSLALNNKNYYGGATTVNNGTVTTGNAHALGGGTGNVTVGNGANAGVTLDLNGVTQTAGKSYVLNSGSLVNNTGTPVSIGTGASVNFAGNGTNGTGSWSSGTPTVSIAGGGGSGATAQVVMQLGFLSLTGGTAGSGYVTEPKISFSAPDLSAAQGGRPIKAVAALSNNGGTQGTVTTINIIDPGFGYLSVPTMTIDNTGTGGTGFAPAFAMTAGAVEVTSGGSGYSSAPTVTVGGAGYLAGSALPVASFGQVSLTTGTTNSMGGSGDIAVGAVISGAGNLDKTGIGKLTLNNTNTYTGATNVNAGTLGGTGSIANSAVSVNSGATLAPGASIGTFGTGSFTLASGGTLAMELDLGGTPNADLLNVTGGVTLGASSILALSLTGSGSYTFLIVANDLADAITTTFGTINVPSGYAATINYAYSGTDALLRTGDGNDIAITISAVPEASAALMGALVVAGAVCAAGYRKFKATAHMEA